MYHSTYRDCLIWRNDGPGYALRWTANAQGAKLAADTLAGLKRLIREELAD